MQKVSFNQIAKIANRISGFSIPIFGISWNPPTLEVELVEKLIVFLEDRRSLYVSLKYEAFRSTVKSIQEIRTRIGKDLENVESSELANILREMAASCRDFLTIVENMEYFDVDDVGSPSPRGRRRRDFFVALVKLRRAFSKSIAQLSVKYGVDLQPELAKMLEEYGALQEDLIESKSERDMKRFLQAR